MSNSLSAQLQQIGLRALPAQLDDFLAHAAKARWSPHQILEQLAQVEITERSRRSLERRLRLSGIKRFKPMADFEWSWPTKIERDVVERALTLDFLPEGRNLVLVGRNGLGKTMIAQNICHAAVLAGHSVLFRSAPALLEKYFSVEDPDKSSAQAQEFGGSLTVPPMDFPGGRFAIVADPHGSNFGLMFLRS